MNLDQLFNQALAHHHAGRLKEAEQGYRQLLAVDANHADALHYLGLIAYGVKQIDAALQLIGRSLALKPQNPDALSNAGNILLENGQVDQAILACRQAIALRPVFPGALNNLGNALVKKGQLDEAILVFRQAVAFQPDYAEAYSNLGTAFVHQFKYSDAIAAYRRAIAINPDYANAHWNLATTLLIVGDLAAAWPEWEWRWKYKAFTSPARNFTAPQWRGESLEGRTLLLHTEQGLGDAIHFARYVPMVAARGGNVVVECQPDLLRLFQHSARGWTVIARGQSLPSFDFHCPMMSLPLVFETTLQNIPHDVPYLSADPSLIQPWRERLRAMAPGAKVGIAWAGNPIHTNDANRSASLGVFRPIASLAGVTCISLQKGSPAAQVAGHAGIPVVDWTAELSDFADTAALVANLDLVITVDTAVAHLAAALGKRVWILLPFVADWRWMRDRSDSPWYPTVRLFRQPAPGDWENVMGEVVDALKTEWR